MKVAVTFENNQVFQHFGKSSAFAIYDIQDGKAADKLIVDTCGKGHSLLADFLKEHQIDTLICGGIGAGAREALNTLGIDIYAGVSGDVDTAVQALIDGTLPKGEAVSCNHHHHHEHEHGEHHTCGEHGCRS